MIVPITDRARRWGYLIWASTADADMRSILGGAPTVTLTFQGTELGSKAVDWKRRRISIGPKRTRELPTTAKNFVLEFASPTLNVTVNAEAE